MKRRSLARVSHEAGHGRAFYFGEDALERRLKKCPRATAWRYGGELRSFQDRTSGDMYRRSFDSVARMHEVVEACLSAEIEPGSYSRIWRKLSPRIRPGKLSRVRNLSIPVAWIESYPGFDWTLSGTPLTFTDCREYDMNSAYGWALTCAPLPMPATAQIVSGRTRRASMVIVQAPDGARIGPPCYRWSHFPMLAPSSDVDRYAFRRAAVKKSVVFESQLDMRPFVDRLYADLPEWIVKHVLRAAWGNYGATAELRQQQVIKGRVIQEHALRGWGFPEIAATIVARVNDRIHNVVMSGGDRGDAVRVFSDSVTLAGGRTLQTGSNPGQWKLQAHYPEMTIGQNPGVVWVKDYMVKHSGFSKADARKKRVEHPRLPALA